MSFYSEIQQAIEDIAKKHGIADEADALPTLDELKGTSIQDEFRQVLEAEAAKKRGEQ